MCTQFIASEIAGSLSRLANGAWRRGERLIDGNCALSIPANSASRATMLRSSRNFERNRMTDHIRIVKHELLRSKCGSFEVRFSDGRESRFFYWDESPSRRLRPDIL